MARWGLSALLTLTALVAGAATVFIPFWIWGHYTLIVPCKTLEAKHFDARHPDAVDIGCIGRIYEGNPIVVIGICLLVVGAWWASWLFYRAWIQRRSNPSRALVLTPLLVHFAFVAFYAWRFWVERYPDN